MKSEHEKKSKNRNRSIPKLEELNPSSVIKIFKYIKDLIENKDLDLDFFNKRDKIFNREELYFVDYYIHSYLKSTKTQSYFKNWLQSQEQYLDSPELFDSFSDYRNSVDTRVIQILDRINVLERIRIAENISIKKNYAEHNTIPISYKIPLIIPFTIKNIDGKITKIFSPKAIDFKQYVIEKLSTVLSEEEALLFYNNSFSVQNNYLPPDLLNLKVVDKYSLGIAIQNIWKRYKSRMFDKDWLLTKRTNAIDKRIKGLKAKKEESTDIEFAIKSLELLHYNITKNRITKKADKLEFMKVLYNSFPYIREGYQKTLKKKNKLSIDEYLKSRISSTIQD